MCKSVRISISVLFCLLFLPVLFAMWSENIDIYVTDIYGRPLQNASVSVIYQSYACNRHEVIGLITNSTGVAHTHIVNTVLEEGVYPPCVEKQYTIRASYMGVENETVGIAGTRSSYYIPLQVAEYRMNVKNSEGAYLYPVTVSYDTSEIISSTGIASIELPLGKGYSLNVSYGEISSIAGVSISSDTASDFTLPVYNLHVRLFNDSGERIKGQIKVANLSQWSLTTEDAVFANFPYVYANFTVIVDGKDLHIGQKITSGVADLYVDMRSPSIVEVSHAFVDGVLRVSASVSDEGASASGLASNPELQYVFNDSSDWIPARLFQRSAKVFEGEMPIGNKSVSYQIIAVDKQGNTEVYDGRYESKIIKASGNKFSISEFISQLYSNLSLSHLIGVAIFIFIIVLVYRKVKEVV